MTKSMLLSLLLLGILCSSRADVTMIQESETNGGMMSPWTNRITFKFKGSKVRTDNPGTSTISDLESGEQISLMHLQKQYSRFSPSQMKESLEWLTKAQRYGPRETNEVSTPVATGKKERINGFDTEQFVWESPKAKHSFWITKSITNRYYSPGSFSARMGKPMAGTPNRTPGLFPDSPLPGMPIRTESEMPIPVPVGLSPQQLKQMGFVEGQRFKSVTTIISFTEGAIDDVEFRIPADYNEFRTQTALPATVPLNPDTNAFADILRNMRKQGLSDADAKSLEALIKVSNEAASPGKKTAPTKK